MSKLDAGVLGPLMGRQLHRGLEIVASEQRLSRKHFPKELLEQELRREFEQCERWLSTLVQRDAEELSFAALLTGTLPQLKVAQDENSELK